MIIAQAPGMLARQSGKPFDDRSGHRLRMWLGVDREQFYDETKFAMVAMGFCYPGKTAMGDLPPCEECAPIWHPQILPHLRRISLTLLVGSYALNYYLDSESVTDTVKKWRSCLPENILPLPHPSWHNNAWLTKNPWFEKDLVPTLRKLVQTALTCRYSEM